MSTCWLNGALVSKAQANVSVYDHGLLYGDGIFEGIRFYNGCPFLLDAHLQRLHQSAAALLLEIPYTTAELTRAVHDTVTAFGKANGYLRLVVTRGVGRLGVDPESCERATTFIIADDLHVTAKEAKERGIRAIIASTRRVPNSSWDARIKSLNYLNNVLARLEARNANADEAILLNHAGNVAEGALNNVFVVKNDILMTPPTSDGALAGITRDLLLELAMQQNIATQQCSLTPYDLYTADECFLTGTGTELVALREVDGRKVRFCPGELYSLMQDAFENYIQMETKNVTKLAMESWT